VPIPLDRRLITDIASAGGKTLTGETCTVQWRVINAATDVRRQTPPTELFVYVASGAVRLAAAGQTSVLTPGTIAIPAAMRNVILTPSGGQNATLIEFALRAP
jgi:hypothetical protein